MADVDCCLAAGRREAAERLRGERREGVSVGAEDDEDVDGVADVTDRGDKVEAEEWNAHADRGRAATGGSNCPASLCTRTLFIVRKSTVGCLLPVSETKWGGAWAWLRVMCTGLVVTREKERFGVKLWRFFFHHQTQHFAVVAFWPMGEPNVGP